MDVARLREQIPTCQRMTYVNTGWSGPTPMPVVEAVKKRLEYESYEGPTSQPVLDSSHEIKDQAKQSIAQLLNVTAEEIGLTQNTTEGLNIVLSGFPWEDGDEIITFDIEHSSVMIPCLYAQKRRGVQVKVVSLSPDHSWDDIVSNVEKELTSRTRMLVFSHIQYSYGFRMPVHELRKLTSDRGIYMLLDGAQTPGHIELDLPSLGVEFYSIPCHKWLLGPDGAGAVYTRRDLIPLIEPSYVGYYAVDSEEQPLKLTPDSESTDKFGLTTTSTPVIAGFNEAINFIQEIGMGEIEARNKELAGKLKARLTEIPGASLLSPEEGPGITGLTSVRLDGVDCGDAAERLWTEHNIVARAVGELSCIRVSTDFFNTEEELEKIAGAISGLRN